MPRKRSGEFERDGGERWWFVFLTASIMFGVASNSCGVYPLVQTPVEELETVEVDVAEFPEDATIRTPEPGYSSPIGDMTREASRAAASKLREAFDADVGHDQVEAWTRPFAERAIEEQTDKRTVAGDADGRMKIRVSRYGVEEVETEPSVHAYVTASLVDETGWTTRGMEIIQHGCEGVDTPYYKRSISRGLWFLHSVIELRRRDFRAFFKKGYRQCIGRVVEELFDELGREGGGGFK